MKKEAIKSYFKTLSAAARAAFIAELQDLPSTEENRSERQGYRRSLLDNKQGECPHCHHKKYVRFGTDKGSQRYKCAACKRSFTEYTGTWMAGLHKKDKVDEYLQLMLEEKSLDKIKKSLKINKKTAFDWRHKILSSVAETGKGVFTGITESDETFFAPSQKGKKVTRRKPKKRGRVSERKPLNKGAARKNIVVIVTQDRKKEIDVTVVRKGGLRKTDLENTIGKRLSQQTILCSDSSVVYKGFARDNKLEHHSLRSDMRQYVKKGLYHIQHVNSTHNKLKKWIDHRFWGVSTKYLQQYLNWYRIKEILKGSKQLVLEFAKISMDDITAYQRYKQIPKVYERLLITTPN